MLITQVLRNNALAVAAALMIIGSASAASASSIGELPDGVHVCPISTCIAPAPLNPDDCRWIPNDGTLNDDGCLANPCGTLDCTISALTCPVVMCVATPDNCTRTSNITLAADGCPAFPCGQLICQDLNPTPPIDYGNQGSQDVQSTSATSQASHTSRVLGAVNKTNAPIHRFVNYLYRSSHLGQNPTFGQNRYWLSRITDKPTLGSLFGAMQWQAAHGLDNSL